MTATPTAWPGRSHVSAFVHTLHLLDLDQSEDWPEVTLQTFGPKSNLQHRLRCVEWSLFRLFELYEAKATRDKLKPLFPPTTSLQSVNLRAALLRQLTDLKKDGVLGGNVILRKTMLDECKGDKFEELLATFSLLVLKKVLAKSNDNHNLSSVKSYTLVPLVLSHRKAIQRDLEKRKELDLRARQQQRNIDASIKALSDEAVAWKDRKAPAIPKNADTLKRLVRENWIGDGDWVETLLYGAPPTPGLVHDEPQDDEEDDVSLPLANLHSRVRAQDTRLAQWQGYLKKVQEDRGVGPLPTDLKAIQTPALSARFRRHQDITLNANPTQSWMQDSGLNPRHAILLENLERSMSAKPVPTPGQPVQVRPKNNTFSPSKPFHRSTPTSKRLHSASPARKMSDASSQDTLVAETLMVERGRLPGLSRWEQDEHDTASTGILDTFGVSMGEDSIPVPTSDPASLTERTRASLAQFDTPRAKLRRSKTSISPTRNEPRPMVSTTVPHPESDWSSLAERTRQSMSLLANVLEDQHPPRNNHKANRPRHSKSKSMYIPSQKPRLERAWSEESLTYAAKEEGLDAEADYESVFKSRPRLAMSPNLSPARNNNQLDTDLEDALNKLTINSSSPHY